MVRVWQAILLLWTAACIGAPDLDEFLRPPPQFKNDFGSYSSLLRFNNGTSVQSAADWTKKREEIRAFWTGTLGQWPPLLENPTIEVVSKTNRENLVQQKIKISIAPNEFAEGYLLIPNVKPPCPAVFVPYYEPESSVGLGKVQLRDFAYELAKRGFVTLAIGSPGGDAWKPPQVQCQPLSFLAYVSANCASALAALSEVDPKRIGIVGHSYGGKWAMFSMALSDKFACGVWSDPGIVFDETRPNVNYWEPWYLGKDPKNTRKPGVPTPDNPRTGAYKTLFETGHDLHEVLALIAPRPFMTSGGSEDQLERWKALNRVLEVYDLLGKTNRVAFTRRAHHDPTFESNEQIYSFFEQFLKGDPRN